MSRTDAHSNRLRRRPARVVPAVVIAVVLLALGVGLVWIAVLRLSSGSWPGFVGRAGSWTAALSWGSAVTIAIAAGIAVIGLVLLLAALIPGKPTALRMNTDVLGGEQARTEAVMTRSAVAKLATARADEVDGVDSVSASVGAGSVRVAVKTPSAQRGDVESAVTGRVRDALQAAGLDPMPRISVDARTQKL